MKRTIYAISMLVIIGIIWQLITMFKLVNPLFLPTPLETIQTFYAQLIITQEIWPDIIATIYRTIIAFIIAAMTGIVLGLALGYNKIANSTLGTLVDIARSIPPLALFPLFLLFFGIGDEAKIAVGIWAASLIITINTMYGVKHANKTRLNFAKTYKLSQTNVFTKVILPEAAPHIAAGLRIALSTTLLVVIVTEMFIGTNVGLGHRIIDAQLVYRVPEMYVSIILAGILGYLLNKITLYAEKRIIHWTGR